MSAFMNDGTELFGLISALSSGLLLCVATCEPFGL
jgi:hypothetical protein